MVQFKQGGCEGPGFRQITWLTGRQLASKMSRKMFLGVLVFVIPAALVFFSGRHSCVWSGFFLLTVRARFCLALGFCLCDRTCFFCEGMSER